MTCLNLQLNLSLPPFPDLTLSAPQLPLVPPLNVGVFCCTYQLQIPFVNEIISALNAIVSVAVLTAGVAVNAALQALNVVIAQINAILLNLRFAVPDCPLNSIVGAVTGGVL